MFSDSEKRKPLNLDLEVNQYFKEVKDLQNFPYDLISGVFKKMTDFKYTKPGEPTVIRQYYEELAGCYKSAISRNLVEILYNDLIIFYQESTKEIPGLYVFDFSESKYFIDADWLKSILEKANASENFLYSQEFYQDLYKAFEREKKKMKKWMLPNL